MNPRFTHVSRAAMAAIVLSATPVQSVSKTYDAPPNCNAPTSGESIAYTAPGQIMVPQQPACEPNSQCTDQCDGESTCDNPCPSEPQTDSESSTTEGHHEPHHDGNGVWPIILGVVALGAVVAAADELTGKDWASSNELDANGPRFPIQQKLGRFQVQGYVAAGWPVAVDLDTEPGTSTWLEVRFKGDGQPQSIDLTRPEGGRRVAVVQLPGGYGSIGKARYTVHSALIREGHKPLYRPLRIYGIGAGPNAVGALDVTRGDVRSDDGAHRFAAQLFFVRSGFAVARTTAAVSSPLPSLSALMLSAAAVENPTRVGSFLSVTMFGPQYPSRPADVRWAVAARRPFQRSELDVLELPRDPEGRFTAVLRASIDLFARGQAGGTWGAVPVLTNIRPGTYVLQARAWSTKSGGGDWTGAFAPDYVYIR